MFYGYRCYDSSDNPLGWLYTANAEREYIYTNKDYSWCKRWKTEKGARKNFAGYNHQWKLRSGGYLKIEIMPEISEQSDEKYWDKANSEIIKESKKRYDRRNPTWAFRPKSEISAWLQQERHENESDAALLNRKLEKLMNLEQQGL